MNQETDAIELELEAMRPRELSPQIRSRIARSLAGDSRSNRLLVPWWWGGLLAAAACVALAAFAWHLRSARFPAPENLLPAPREVATTPTPDATLGSYKLAFARSTDRFDALLDKEAARPMATANGDPRPPRLFDLNLIP